MMQYTVYSLGEEMNYNESNVGSLFRFFRKSRNHTTVALVMVATLFLNTPLLAGWKDAFSGFIPVKKRELEVYKSVETVKVLLAHKVDGAMLQLYGRYDVRDPNDAKYLSSGHVGKQSMILPMVKGVSWGEHFPDTYQFAVIPQTSQRTFILDGVQHEGVLYVYQIDGKLSLVNELPLESYVRSVVSTQAEETMHEEALASLAVCVRTHALWSRHNKADGFWHVFAPDVGFIGMAGASRNSASQIATTTTDGMVMRDPLYPQNDGLFPAAWTGQCRGSRQEGFNEDSLKNHTVIGDQTKGLKRGNSSKPKQWNTQITSRDFVSTLYPGVENLQVTNILLKRDPSTKRVVAVSIEFNSKPQKILSVLRFSQLFPGVLGKSFEMKETAKGFIFEGEGDSIDEGLCLFSADRLAQAGKDAPEILGHFFPGTRMEMAWTIEKQYVEL